MRLLLFLLLCASSVAQTVRLANYSTGEFAGWLRTTVNVPTTDADATAALPECGLLEDGTTYVLGRRIGTDVRVCDVRVTLHPGQLRSLDLHKAKLAAYDLPPLPSDTGWPAVAGIPLVPAAGPWLQRDGAAWLVHLHARITPMLHVDLWSWVYPGQPWARGEVVVCASNNRVPDMVAVIPEGMKLSCGDAAVIVPGLADGAPLLPAGEVLGDGQAKAFPVTLVWASALRKPVEATSAGAVSRFEIGAVGLSRLHAVLGNPELPARFDPVAWARQNRQGAIDRLHTWAAGPLGVSARSGDTGAQEDQGWCSGAEAMHPLGVGCEQINYLVALGMARRPCHHLEPWGQLLDLRQHEGVVFWSGRAHYRKDLFPEQLGKTRQQTDAETHGWSGPDDEHWLLNRLAAAARLTGSPACQWLLEAQARCYLLQDTVKPGLSTSTARAARARGWAGIAVTHLWTTLEDRALAEQVAARWRQRVAIYRSAVVQPGDVWQLEQDARVLSEVKGGATTARMPYQEAVGAFGVWLGSECCGPWDGRSLAVACARGLVQAGYSQQGGRWVEWDFIRWPNPAYVEGDGAHRTGWFAQAWWPFGVWTAAQAGDERARAIWQQMHSEALAGSALPLTWFPPVSW